MSMTLEQLREIKAKKFELVQVRRLIAEEAKKLADKTGYRKQVLCCCGTGCHSSKSELVAKTFEDELKAKGVNDVLVIRTGCFGLCALGPVVIVYPEGVFYSQTTPEGAKRIVDEHIVNGNVCKDLLYPETVHENGEILPLKGTNFYKKQMRIALRNCGVIDPENIEEYIASDGYEALAKVITTMKPEEAIEEMKKSGLRGRGGAGFSTGMKWFFASQSKADQKYVVCNADEGDPGAFMDRSILEGDPNSIIEAMAICGYCIGATKGLVYIRAEYPLAIHRLQVAIDQARKYGLLGSNIFGTDFSFDITLRYGAGAFVCGEETALIHSMEGDRGEPTVKPPFPAVKGYMAKPTNVNNVETFANVPIIYLKGADWYSSIGTEKSKGTKVFALAGKINNVGLIEVPMGTTLREVIYEIGGGVKGGKQFKAVQTGGPSGGCLTAKHLDTPIDYESLAAAKSIMGSGGMIVMDEDNCMVAIAKFYLDFTVDESCGKCSPCRIGNKRMNEILDKIIKGNGTLKDVEELKNLANVIKDTALCGLGQTAPNPVLSTIDNFYDEYVAHVVDKKCPAGQCRDLLSYVIDPSLCKGCTKCARNCPVNAISGTIKNPHVIDQSKCIKCGTCMSNCPFKAISNH